MRVVITVVAALGLLGGLFTVARALESDELSQCFGENGEPYQAESCESVRECGAATRYSNECLEELR